MALTPIQSFKGAKNKHSMTLCRCDCGGERLVRSTKLRLGLVTMCGSCAKRAAAQRGGASRRLPPAVARRRELRGIYIANARRRGLAFELSEHQVADLTGGSCRYCGTEPAGGIDRIANAIGYTLGNSASCCSMCNYAKRDMTESKFLDWIRRVNEHQSVLQRDRDLLLRLAEQPDGCGVNYTRSDR